MVAEISRRGVLGLFGAGAAGAGAVAAARAVSAGPGGGFGGGAGVVAAENRRAGSGAWRVGADATTAADDFAGQVKGYASAVSVNVGGAIGFHVSTNPAQPFTVEVWRMGHYGGAGARRAAASPVLHGTPGAAPGVDADTGMVTCDWPVSWTLHVPGSWVSGAYLAVFTTAGGHRSYTPFVVRDDARAADLLVVLPYSTYQAYNQWPTDGHTGRSLYVGYGRAASVGGAADGVTTAEGVGGVVSYALRSRQVSFDRPYAGVGMPLRADLDHDTVGWLEAGGYDVVYTTSVDLHAGRVDPSRYRGLVFSGHDEYWSAAMRGVAEHSVAAGVGLAYLTANNVYWHVRFSPSAAGAADRVMTCYKTDPDPLADASGATTLWRDMAPRSRHAEQGLLGVQYVGIVAGFHPLVVAGAGHWVWAGAGVRDGEAIPRLVGGEADARMRTAPTPAGVEQALLSSSPFPLASGRVLAQQTSVYETGDGAVVFTAGTFNWPMGLYRPGFADRRVQKATANLLARITRRPAPA